MRCSTDELLWWEKYPIYQIYPRSFKDSTGNGTGDINGITEKLDYFEWLGIKVLWLCPVYKSPMADFGYDISDYRQVDPLFGTNDDLKNLIEKMHKKGMFLIMDFVPNHSSNQHPWFLSSIRRSGKYTDYYVWHDGKVDTVTGKRLPPNKWESVFGGSAWTWCEERKQFYLHQFLSDQPDLNYRCPELQQEMKDVLLFWLEMGVDGFRIDAIIHLVEDALFRDNVSAFGSWKRFWAAVKHKKLKPIRYDVNQPETYEIVKTWVDLVRSYGKSHDRYILMVTEGYTALEHLMKYYHVGVDFPFNFALTCWKKETDVETLRFWIRQWLNCMPTEAWPNWVIGNHDLPRVASRLGSSEYASVANMLLLLLPGTATCYYGDELGMVNVPVEHRKTHDLVGKCSQPEHSRDPYRSPMLWSDTTNAGFTTATNPWLPVQANYSEVCVDVQMANPKSHLHIFRKLLLLRQEPAFLLPRNVKLITFGPKAIVCFTRPFQTSTFVVLINLSLRDTTVDLSKHVNGKGTVALDSLSLFDSSAEVDISAVTLKPVQGLVIHVQA